MSQKTSLPMISSNLTLSKYLEDIKKFPLLSEKEEEDFANDWYYNHNVTAAHILVTSHLRLVAKIAMQFKGYGLPMLDVISEGNIGLMTAVKKFNPTLGHRLSTYAIWWIKATIQDYILKSWSIVKVGTSATHKKLFFNLKKIRSKIVQANHGYLPSNADALIANELNVEEEEVRYMNNAIESADASLNDYTSADSSIEVIDTLHSNYESPEYIVLEDDERSFRMNKLQSAMAHLSERDKEILHARRLTIPAVTLEELAMKFDISKERVRQIEEAVIKKLQKHANSN